MRATLALALLAAAGCSWTPDVSSHRPKLAADCPGQKACGDRCVDQDDPIAGCGPASCLPCPGAPANAVPVCGAGQACGFACLPGFADADKDPANGCERDVRTDDLNCGAMGHACTGCANGLCPTSKVTNTASEPRGLAVANDVWWGEATPPGTLNRCDLAGNPLAGATGFGTVGWVRANGATALIAGTELLVGGRAQGTAWIFSPATPSARPKALTSGVESIPAIELTATDVVGIIDPLHVQSSRWVYPFYGSTLTVDAPVHGLTLAGNFLWLGGDAGIYQTDLYSQSASVVIPFAGLPRTPRPDRLAATSTSLEFYFADLSDGSVWRAPSGATPYRLVRGDGPRTQMDVRGDSTGVVWSDLDRGEIWAVSPGGQPYLVARGRPWAIALTTDKIWWTDVEAQQIRTVPR